jgi:hypothetical protein
MEFCVNVDGKQLPASDVLSLNQLPDDPEKMEHVVPIEWAETVPEDDAIDEPVRQPQHGLRAQNPEVADNH